MPLVFPALLLNTSPRTPSLPPKNKAAAPYRLYESLVPPSPTAHEAGTLCRGAHAWWLTVGEWPKSRGSEFKGARFRDTTGESHSSAIFHDHTPERVNRRRHPQSQSPPDQAPRLSSVAMITAADIDPTAMNSPKFRLIAVQCVRPRPEPPGDPRANRVLGTSTDRDARCGCYPRAACCEVEATPPGRPPAHVRHRTPRFRPSSRGASPRERASRPPRAPIPTTRRLTLFFLRARASSVRPLPLLRPSFSRSRRLARWRRRTAAWLVPTR